MYPVRLVAGGQTQRRDSDAASNARERRDGTNERGVRRYAPSKLHGGGQTREAEDSANTVRQEEGGMGIGAPAPRDGAAVVAATAVGLPPAHGALARAPRLPLRAGTHTRPLLSST